MAAEHAAAVHAAAESRLAVAHTAEQLAALDATVATELEAVKSGYERLQQEKSVLERRASVAEASAASVRKRLPPLFLPGDTRFCRWSFCRLPLPLSTVLQRELSLERKSCAERAVEGERESTMAPLWLLAQVVGCFSCGEFIEANKVALCRRARRGKRQKSVPRPMRLRQRGAVSARPACSAHAPAQERRRRAPLRQRRRCGSGRVNSRRPTRLRRALSALSGAWRPSSHRSARCATRHCSWARLCARPRQGARRHG